MAITKTDFLNFTRCKRYVSLEEIKRDGLDADISFLEYQKKEQEEQIKELYAQMIEEGPEIIDKTAIVNKQLEAMLPYYKMVEEEAGKIAKKYFKGQTIYAQNTLEQASFEFFHEGIRYLCYVDIYNENEEEINIIEVKATTATKYLKLESGYPKKEKYSIFHKVNNIYYLKGELENYPLEIEMPYEKYEKEREKLLDRYRLGNYIHDLAVQRYIIEKSALKKEKPIHYYLAVLNPNYIFDGKMVNNLPFYRELNGEELITFFQMDEITKEYQEVIEKERVSIENYLENLDANEVPLSSSCGYKSQNCCKFFKSVCGNKIPKENSSLNYLNNGQGFIKEDGTRVKGLELINEGYLDMLQVPEEWITKTNHQIQRESLKNHTQFIQKEKIKKAIASLEYPIYHLDFETFPCPLPRFKGEWPYIQSPFEFSLHIESAPGVCDKTKDNVVFLANTLEDEREDLIKTLLKFINPNKGTLFAQNVAFEKGRIKELAHIFPKYQEDLMKIYQRGFDLLWIVQNNKELYQSLGFKPKECETINFYDERLSGSFSIKKTLPVFSNLTYKNLDVKNGTDAIVEYANYNKMSKEELQVTKEALRIYCQQDTWAMVEILDALRKIVL